MRSMAQLARTVDGAKQPPPRGRVSPIGPRWRRVLAADCCRRSLRLGLDASTRARGPPRSSPPPSGERPQTPLKATYGAPEPTHGSPAIMVRMSVRHCVEISSRGDGARRFSNVLAAAAKRGKTRPRRTQPSAIRRRRATRARPTGEAITARWRDLQRHRAAAAARGRPPHTHTYAEPSRAPIAHPSPTTGPRGLPQVHLERREARQAPGVDPTVLEGHRQIPADDAEARVRGRV